MVRTQPLPPFSPAPAICDPYLDLGRLLSRLDRNILRADGDRWRRLVTDEFQRQQARFDVTAARNLLTRIEQDALSIKAHSRRQEAQGELGRRRALVEQLQERLDDLDEEARAAAAIAEDYEEEDGEEADGTEDGEGQSSLSSADDILAHIIQTPSESMDSRSTGMNTRSSSSLLGEEAEQDVDATTPPAPQPKRTESSSSSAKKVRIAKRPKAPKAAKKQQTQDSAPTTTATATPTATATATAAPPQATMRARKGRGTSFPGDGTARSTSAQIGEAKVVSASSRQESSTTALRNSLMSPSGDGDGATAVATEEVLLDHHRREQEVLSEDILRLAQALKERSLTTSRMLEDDKDVVDRVGEGLHKTNESLTAASRSMAVLTRMTEGKGWWGRMLLFAMVYGLMALLLLLFFFLPKLRF